MATDDHRYAHDCSVSLLGSPASSRQRGPAGSAALTRSLRPTVGPPPPEIDPRVVRVSVASQALGVRKAFYVYVPCGSLSPGRRYPVLYLLRGHEREWVNPREDATRSGTVIDVYERLLRAGSIGPMVLVFPGLTSDDGRVHSVATDLRARALAPDTPGLGTGRFATYLVHELIPLVDALFPTLPGGRHRGFDGFSLGGLMAVKVAAQYPGLATTAGAYDGTFLYATLDGAGMRADDRVYSAGIFDAVFGRPRDEAFAIANNPANLILTQPVAELRRVCWMIQYGPRRLEPLGSNFYRGRYLRTLLAQRGIAGNVQDVLPDGAHDWATADRHMAMTLPLHWKTLRGDEDSTAAPSSLSAR